MARPGVDLAALKRAQLFGSDVQASRPRAGSGSAPLGSAPASCQDWQGAFVVTHIGRAGLIMQGSH